MFRMLRQLALLSYSLAASLAIAAGQSPAPSSPAAGSPSPTPVPFRSGVWPSRPPSNCPFPPSESLAAVDFTGRYAGYGFADTWFPSWASDGNLYSAFADGIVTHQHASGGGKEASTGFATISGDDPLHLQVVGDGVYFSDPTPYAGRYPSASLVYNGVWYYGTYCLGPAGWVKHDGITYNWPTMGPFVGFRTSSAYGTWTQTPCTPSKPLFGENPLDGVPVKIGAPHFVDFGKNMEHSPDGCAYLVAGGASDPVNRRFGYDSWCTADEVYLLRVKPSIETINDASKYEFFAGHDSAGHDVWSKDFKKIQPIAAWRDNMGSVTMTYNAPLKKYLMCVTDGRFTTSYFNTYILESDNMTGPWKLVSYFERFGEQAYFVNVPSKFIGADGRKLWLCYSADFYQKGHLVATPVGSGYSMILQEVNLLPPGAAGLRVPPSPPVHRD